MEILYALISALEKEKSINLMSRREMEETLHRLGLVQSDNPEMVLKAGKALGVNFILFGQVTKKSGQIIAQVKLMDVENATVLNTWDQIFSGREDILHKISSFAMELRGTIEKRELYLPPSPPPKAQTQIEIHIKNLRAKSKGKTIVLSWKCDPSQPIAGFNVYRAENREGPYRFLGKTNKNIYNDANIKKRKYYYYHIGIILSSGKEIKDSHAAQVINMGEKLPHPPVIMSIKGYLRRTEIKFVPSLLNDQEKFEIIKYKIYRQKNSSGEWENISSIDAKIKPQSGLAFTVEDTNNIGDGETYSYAIASLDKEKRESPKSDPVSVKTISPPVLKVEKDDLLRKIILSWQPLENVKGYCLYRKADQEDWKKIGKITEAQKSQFTDDKDLEDGQHYQYYLTTYDAERETGPSNRLKAKTKDLPPIPEDLQTQSGLVKSVQISWTPVEDPDVGGYAIYRGTDRKELVRIAKVKGYKSDSFLDKGKAFRPLEDGKDYYYSITCFNLFGAEGKNTYASLARTKPRPSNVKGLMATAEQAHILVRWENNPEPDIRRYILYRNRNGRKWRAIQNLDAGQTSYKDDDLKPEDTYLYRVIAEDIDGLKSDPVESDSVLSPIVPVLALEKDGLLRKIILSWQPLKNVKGYYLYRKSDLEDWKRVARISGGQESDFTDKKDLKDGQHYQYYLTTYDAERETGPSNRLKAKTKDLPPIPEDLQTQSGLVKSVQISWTPVEDPDVGGYAIYRGTDRKELVRIAKVKGYKSDSFLDKGKAFRPLEDGKDYYYSITCFNLFGAEGKNTYASLARTKPRPSNVKGLMATAEQAHILVRWENNPEPDIKVYILYRSRNDRSWSKIQTLGPDQTSYKDTDLKPDSNYRYKIMAVDNDDLKSDPVESDSVLSPVVKSEG